MKQGERQALRTIRAYLGALESGASADAVAFYFTPDAEQIEHPNRLNPNGGRSDLATLRTRLERGRTLLKQQRYEILSLIARDNTVAAEILWTGTLAKSSGAMPAGLELKAHIAIFFEMQDGKIHRQRNYDCFEAW
jgi:ketosteroid isomerase-like protein